MSGRGGMLCCAVLCTTICKKIPHLQAWMRWVRPAWCACLPLRPMVHNPSCPPDLPHEQQDRAPASIMRIASTSLQHSLHGPGNPRENLKRDPTWSPSKLTVMMGHREVVVCVLGGVGGQEGQGTTRVLGRTFFQLGLSPCWCVQCKLQGGSPAICAEKLWKLLRNWGHFNRRAVGAC